MPRKDKTVFISYRRSDWSAATLVFQNLSQHGFDVFIDADGLASGDFERAILENIRARAHFVVVLTPTALDRCGDPDDWLRREVEAALASQRNVVPLLLNGFSFDADAARQHLQGSLAPLKRYNALTVPQGYFDDAMERLRSRYLAVSTDAVLHPPSAHAQKVAEQQQALASQAAAGQPVAVPNPASTNPVAPKPTVPKPRKPRDPKAMALKLEQERLTEPETPTERGLQWLIVSAGLVAALGGAYALNGLAERSLQALGAIASDIFGSPSRGVVLPSQVGPPHTDAQATQRLREAAERGHAPSQVDLGKLYSQGRGVPQDDTQAVFWYLKAAQQGDARGRFFLGNMYEAGRGGLPRDPAKAAGLYRQAAAQGNVAAQLMLGTASGR